MKKIKRHISHMWQPTTKIVLSEFNNNEDEETAVV